MEETRRRKYKKRRFSGKPWMLLFALAMVIFAVAGFRMVQTMLAYRQSSEEYKALETYVTVTEPYTDEEESSRGSTAGSSLSETEETRKEPLAGEEVIDDPGIEVDFTSLKKKNEDILGWLYYPALDISYPLVQGEDNAYYLHHTAEKTANFAGSIFMEYQNAADLSDPNTIVYGHNMRNGSMFGKLKNILKKKKLTKKTRTFWILTPEKTYEYRVFSVQEAATGGEVYSLYPEADTAFLTYLQQLADASILDFGEVSLTQEDKVVILSTCTGNEKTRLAVSAKCLNP